MNNYNRNNRSGGRDFNRRGSGPRQMFKAVCDECGKECEVPFRPSGDKPIYCSECFKSKGGGFKRSSGDSGQMNEVLKKLDIVLEKLDQLTQSKPKTKKPKKAEKSEK